MTEKAKLGKKDDKKKSTVMASRTWLGAYKLLLLRMPFWLRERLLFQWLVFFTLMFPYMFHVSFDELDADGDDDFDADDIPMFLGVKRRAGKKSGGSSVSNNNQSGERQPLKSVQRVREPPHQKITECGHFMDERRWWCRHCKALIEMDCGHFFHQPQQGCAGCDQRTLECKPTPHSKDKIDPYCSTCADWEDAQGTMMVRKTKERPFQKEKGPHVQRKNCSHYKDEFKFWCRNCWVDPQLACGHFVDDPADPNCEVCEVVRATILPCGHFMGKPVDDCKQCVLHEKQLEESTVLWKRAAQAVRNVYSNESPAIHQRRNKDDPATAKVWEKPVPHTDARVKQLERDLSDAMSGKAPPGKKEVAFEPLEVKRFQDGLLVQRGWDTKRQPPGFSRPVRCDHLLDAIHAMKGKTDFDCGHLTDKPNPKCMVCRAQKSLAIDPCYHRRDQLQKHCPHCEFIREVLSAKIDEEEYSPRQMKKAFPYFIVGESACVFFFWLTMSFWATWKVSTSGQPDILRGNMFYYDQAINKKGSNVTRFFFWDLKAGLETFREHTFELGVFGPNCEDYRWSFWRWFGYQFSHVGANHVCMNVLMNLLLGIPLEMVECQDTVFDPAALPPEGKRTVQENERMARYKAIKEDPLKYVDIQENPLDGSFYVLRTLPTGAELEAKFAANGAPAWFDGPDQDEVEKNWVRDPDKVCTDDNCPCMKTTVDDARKEKRGMKNQDRALIDRCFPRSKDCHLPNCPACENGMLQPEEQSRFKLPPNLQLPIYKHPAPKTAICHFPCCPCWEEDPRKKVLPQPYVNACPPGALVKGHGIMFLMFQVGVFGGACCHMFNDAHTPVVGCSGGTYSLIGMNLSNLAMNWNETKFRIPKLVMLALMVFSEFYCFAMSVGETEVSNSAHMGGAVAGFIIGVLVGRNFSAESGHEDKKEANTEKIFKLVMLILGIALIIWSFAWMWTQAGARSIWEAMEGKHAWCWTQQVFDASVDKEDFFCVRCGTEPGCIDHWKQYKNHGDVDYKKECDGIGYKSTHRGYYYDGR